MTMPQPMVVGTDDDVEPLLQHARAEVAKARLQLRSAMQEAEAAEATAAAFDPARNRALLEASLETMIADRRAELDAGLEAEREAGAQVVAAARARANVLVAQAPQPRPQPEPSATEPVEPAAPELASAPEVTVPAPPPVIDLTESPAVELTDPAAPARVAEVPDAVPATVSGPAMDMLSVEAVREMLAAAVAAAVGGGAGSTGDAPAATPSPVSSTAPRSSWWRLLGHVDVLLPLLAASIVVVVLLAWFA